MRGLDARTVIRQFDLQPHPEGGWFRETWRAAPAAGEARGAGTAILFLLERGQRSHWHRIDASELWVFQAGASLHLRTAVDGAGLTTTEHTLGVDVVGGEQLQQVVRPGEWQSAETSGAWSFVTCVVAPAFEFSGFELAPRGWEPGSPTPQPTQPPTPRSTRS